MLFFLILSVFHLTAFAMPSEFFELETPQEVTKCLSAHSKEVEICSDALTAILVNITAEIKEALKSYPELLSHSAKKTICCGFYEWERCALQAVSPTAGCDKQLVQFFKLVEAEDSPPKLSFKKFCVEFPKESNECL
jgi:hypothetical protein